MPIITTTRGDIHYKDYRHPDFDGIPFVLIHGAGSQYNDYHPRMRRGLPSIALDLPGHGKSPSSGEISIANYTSDILAFIQALNLNKIILVGHSMGGGIAQQFALDYPEYLHGMILIATGANLLVNQMIIDGIVDKPQETAYLVTKWSWGKTADEKLLQQGVAHLLETSVDVIQGDYIACNNFDVRDRLHEIKTPALIIAGTLDKMTQLAWNQELAEKISNNQIYIFEESGHQVHIEQAEEATRLMLEWSQKL